MYRSSTSRVARRDRGAALITVLWLTAALAMIGFSVAATVRGEAGRAANSLDGARAEFLARGAVERMMFYLISPPFSQPGKVLDYQPGQQRMYWRFPGGDVLVELVPESGKLNVNAAKPEQLIAVMLAAGYPSAQASQLTDAILDWRTTPPGGVSDTDSYYLSVSPTFRPRHSSFQQIEELLIVRGVTPHIYHGGLERIPGGPVVSRPGLYDLLSVQGSTEIFDVNSAHPAVLSAAGVPPGDVQMIVDLRRQVPFTAETLRGLTVSGGPALRVLRAGLDQSYLIKATARPRLGDGRLSDFRWTTAALVVYETVMNNYQTPRIRAWYPGTATGTPWPEAGN